MVLITRGRPESMKSTGVPTDQYRSTNFLQGLNIWLQQRTRGRSQLECRGSNFEDFRDHALIPSKKFVRRGWNLVDSGRSQSAVARNSPKLKNGRNCLLGAIVRIIVINIRI